MLEYNWRINEFTTEWQPYRGHGRIYMTWTGRSFHRLYMCMYSTDSAQSMSIYQCATNFGILADGLLIMDYLFQEARVSYYIHSLIENMPYIMKIILIYIHHNSSRWNHTSSFVVAFSAFFWHNETWQLATHQILRIYFCPKEKHRKTLISSMLNAVFWVYIVLKLRNGRNFNKMKQRLNKKIHGSMLERCDSCDWTQN